MNPKVHGVSDPLPPFVGVHAFMFLELQKHVHYIYGISLASETLYLTVGKYILEEKKNILNQWLECIIFIICNTSQHSDDGIGNYIATDLSEMG